jgi:hypothetical protein
MAHILTQNPRPAVFAACSSYDRLLVLAPVCACQHRNRHMPIPKAPVQSPIKCLAAVIWPKCIFAANGLIPAPASGASPSHCNAGLSEDNLLSRLLTTLSQGMLEAVSLLTLCCGRFAQLDSTLNRKSKELEFSGTLNLFAPLGWKYRSATSAIKLSVTNMPDGYSLNWFTVQLKNEP